MGFELLTCYSSSWVMRPPRDGVRSQGAGLHTILLLPILYGVWHTQGRSGGGLILPNSRAIVLQQCGQCTWGGGGGGVKGRLIRVQTPYTKRISCKGQPGSRCYVKERSLSQLGSPERLGSSGPNLEPGTMRVYETNGPRNGLNIDRKVNPYPGSRRRCVLGSVHTFL